MGYVFFLLYSNATTPYVCTLSLHDALPISLVRVVLVPGTQRAAVDERTDAPGRGAWLHPDRARSEEHTSELQSRGHLVCRLLLEKKKTEIVGESKQQHGL